MSMRRGAAASLPARLPGREARRGRMPTLVEMPKLGNTVEECLLTAWRKTKGDPVQEGEVIADIETDKTTFELTAPAGGILLETFFEAGALIPVFTAVCVIGAVGESV